MRKRRRGKKKPQKPLDTVLRKPATRGRRPRMRASETRGRAEQHRFIFDQVWGRLWPLLSTAENEENVINGFPRGSKPLHTDLRARRGVTTPTPANESARKLICASRCSLGKLRVAHDLENKARQAFAPATFAQRSALSKSAPLTSSATSTTSNALAGTRAGLVIMLAPSVVRTSRSQRWLPPSRISTSVELILLSPHVTYVRSVATTMA